MRVENEIVLRISAKVISFFSCSNHLSRVTNSCNKWDARATVIVQIPLSHEGDH